MSVLKHQESVRNTVLIPRAAIIVNVMTNTMKEKVMNTRVKEKIKYNHGLSLQINTIFEICRLMLQYTI